MLLRDTQPISPLAFTKGTDIGMHVAANTILLPLAAASIAYLVGQLGKAYAYHNARKAQKSLDETGIHASDVHSSLPTTSPITAKRWIISKHP